MVLLEGMKVALFGKVEFDSYSGELQMLHPEFEILSPTMRMAKPRCTWAASWPIYEGVAKLTTRVLRTITHRIFAEWPAGRG